MNNHIDYIHYNPVKHGLVMDPKDHSYSSFHDYYRDGLYNDDWGVKDKLIFNGNYGE
jgi:putative transposase